MGDSGTFVSVETRAHPLAAVTQTVVGALHASVVVEARESGVLHLLGRGGEEIGGGG